MQGGLQITTTSDGGFVATGQHESNGSSGGCDIYVYRVDVCGNLVWFKLFGQSNTGEGGKSINETADGGFIVAGHYADGIGFNLRLDSDGNMMWFKTYSGTQWLMYSEEADNGDILSLGHPGLKLIRCNSLGDVVWSKELGDLGDMALYLHEMNNHDIVVSSVGSGNGRDFCLARLDSVGTMLWSKGYGSGWSDNDFTSWSNRGSVDEASGVITITCPTYAGSMGGENILVSQVNLTTGDVVWAKSYGGVNSDQSRDIAPHPGGFAIVGNSASFNTAPDPANNITEALSERDILLFSIDFQGDLEWSRTYGGSERDKGIGVRYNIDNGYTISAYTTSPYFGNFDDSMDPLFMKTDSVGFVACQMFSPTLTVEDIVLTAYLQGNSTPSSISAVTTNPILSNYVPNDFYACQSCSTEPIFQPSDTLICTGEQVEFINTTQVGLTCFQEWYVNGETYNGGSDLTYSFNVPGDYTVELYSTCGGEANTFELNLHVFEVGSTYTTSNYNGYGISCFGANDGSIDVNPSGGYLGVGGNYNISWNDGATGPLRDPLIAGSYIYYLTDSIGCIDSNLVVLDEPAILEASGSIITDYNGYGVSCFGANDGGIQFSSSGGNGSLNFTWQLNGATFNSATNPTLNLFAGDYTMTVQDEYSCGPILLDFHITEPDAIEFEILALSDYNGYPVTCNGADDATVFFDYYGGVSPYGLTLNNSVPLDQDFISGLTAGGNSIQITDANGCMLDTSLSLNEPLALLSNIDISSDYNGYDISCFGAYDGRAEVEMFGGVQPYYYLWSDGSINSVSDTDLGAGIVSVVITDANGCVTMNDTILGEPEALAVDIFALSDFNGYNVSCPNSSDGSIGSSVSGGTGQYNYSWHTGGTNAPILDNLPVGTYMLELTDNNLCGPVYDTISLFAPTPLFLTIQSDYSYNGYDISCNGLSDGGVTANLSGGVIPYSTTWSTGATDLFSLNNLSGGTYNLNVTDNNGCEISSSISLHEPTAIHLQPYVISDFNGFALSCNSSSDGVVECVPSGGTSSYTITWSNGSTEWTNSGLTAGYYDFEVADNNGCIALGGINIEGPPVILIDEVLSSDYNGFDLSCAGSQDGEIQISAFGGAGSINYLWSDGWVGNLHSDLMAGDHLINIVDANGCFIDTSITLLEPEPIQASWLTWSDFNGFHVSCHSSIDGFVTAQVEGGVAEYNYHWDSFESNINSLNGIGAGTHSLYVTDANNCESNLLVIEFNQPEVLVANMIVTSDYHSAQVSCHGASDGVAEVFVGGGVPGYTYQWADGGIASISNTFLSAGIHTVDFWDANNCAGQASIEVIEPDAVGVVLEVVTDYNDFDVSCFGMTDAAVIAHCEGGTGDVTAMWSNNVQGYLNPSIGAGTYQCEAVDINGCSANATIQINEPEELSAHLEVYSDYNGSDISCFGAIDGQAASYVNGGVPPYSYYWSDGSLDYLSGLDLGSGDVDLQIEDANGCWHYDTIELVSPTPLTLSSFVTSNYLGFSVSCFGGSDGIAEAIANGGTGEITYSWSNGSMGAILENVPSGIYSVSIDDANGCSMEGDLIELTQPSPIQGAISLISNYNGFNVSCFGSNDGYAEAIAFGGVPDYSYVWSNGEVGYLAEGLSQGPNTVLVVDANNCQHLIELNLSAPSNLNITSSSTADTCSMGLGSAEVSATGGAGNYLFFWSNGTIGPQTCCLQSGQLYTVLAYDENLCEDSITISIENIPPPQISITIESETPICIDSTEVYLKAAEASVYIDTVDGGLLPYGGGGSIYWQWFLNGKLQSEQDKQISRVFHQNGEVIVKLEGKYLSGCASEVYSLLNVEDVSTLFIPSAFTPGNDGVNDAFEVKGSQIQNYEINIFDRWGNIYFNSNDMNQEWNGTHFNSNYDAKPDAYIYEIKSIGVCGEEKKEVGHVILIR